MTSPWMQHIPPSFVKWASQLHKSHHSQTAGQFLFGSGIALKEILKIITAVMEAIHMKGTVYFPVFSASLIFVLVVNY